MSVVKLTEYEYTLCVLFSEKSARSQQQIEFGNKQTDRRPVREIREDTLCGKMAEVAVVKMLREEYGLHLPVNYEVYPRGEWDDEDIIINGRTVDVKATQKGRFLLLEKNKIDFRKDQNRLPDIIIMCRTDIDAMQVEIDGCITTKKLTDPKNEKVKWLKAGEAIPGTQVKLQADNYCVEISDLCSAKTAFDYIVGRNKDADR